MNDKRDVWPGGVGGGLPDAFKVGDGDRELGQEALLDDDVDIMREVERPSALDVAFGGEVVGGLLFVGKLMMVFWGFGDHGGIPAVADGFVGASSCTMDLWEILGDGLGSGLHRMRQRGRTGSFKLGAVYILADMRIYVVQRGASAILLSPKEKEDSPTKGMRCS